MTTERTFTVEELELAWDESARYAYWCEHGSGPEPPSDFKNFLYKHFPEIKTYHWKFSYILHEGEEEVSELFIADDSADAARQAWQFISKHSFQPVYTQLTKVD